MTTINPNQPHWYKRRPSIVQAFNLDASKPCLYCGREPHASVHRPAAVQAYLAGRQS